ncbi:MAG: alkaline phosphatase PhoX [Opitutales bacterium]
MESPTSRRKFMKQAGFLSLGFMGLGRLNAGLSGSNPAGYGPLIKDPNGIFDLPKNFSYKVISRIGEKMSDGLIVPGDPDGMAAFGLQDGRIALIRNHELRADQLDKSPFGENNELLTKVASTDLYDFADGKKPAIGGTTTLIYNPKSGKTESEFLSLAGTENNCAGGPTPWGTWVTCEETDQKADAHYKADHGYNFEVPVTSIPTLAKPIPLKEMGRFRHEAIAVDPKSGIVYETEDVWDSLIYRYIPNEPGKLYKGGKLQALVINEVKGWDTRNWSEPGAKPFPKNVAFETSWIDIENPESPENDLRYQGRDKGAAVFARGEGMWYGDGEIYFACTNGGAIRMGQVFKYTPSPYEGTPMEKQVPGKVELFLESEDKDVLKNCDNLCVAPWGDLYIAEDSEAPCKLVGVTPEGTCFDFAANNYNSSELAGCCFSPDGQILFVNIQGTGLTLAITGPWSMRA